MTSTYRNPDGVLPITDDISDIDYNIQQLEREAAQAQTIGSVSAREVAIAQRAISELTTAKAEILAKERVWDRDAQLQRALAERRLAAQRVRLAIGTGGSLDLSLKAALENRLQPKLKITATSTTTLETLKTAVQNAENALGDAVLKDAFTDAERDLKAAESDYRAKSDAAEAAWLAIQNGARNLEERLQIAQAQYAEAARLEDVADSPASGPPAGPVLASAAEAGIAYKSFKDTFTDLERDTTVPSTAPGVPDAGETVLITNWTRATGSAKAALAVLLKCRNDLAVARNNYEQRQALRPARKPEEQARMVASVLRAFNPPAP